MILIAHYTGTLQDIYSALSIPKDTKDLAAKEITTMNMLYTQWSTQKRARLHQTSLDPLLQDSARTYKKVSDFIRNNESLDLKTKIQRQKDLSVDPLPQDVITKMNNIDYQDDIGLLKTDIAKFDHYIKDLTNIKNILPTFIRDAHKQLTIQSQIITLRATLMNQKRMLEEKIPKMAYEKQKQKSKKCEHSSNKIVTHRKTISQVTVVPKCKSPFTIMQATIAQAQVWMQKNNSYMPYQKNIVRHERLEPLTEQEEFDGRKAFYPYEFSLKNYNPSKAVLFTNQKPEV